MKPSVLITGGNRGVGKEIADYFAPNSMSLSRSTGHDIGKVTARADIIQRSLEYDIFVNHAHNGHLEGQTRLLYEIFDTWSNAGKNGYIFNTGSFATVLPQGSFKRYSVMKHAVDVAHAQCCKKIENGFCKFRMTLIRPGMLDTLESQQKPHWQGAGVRGLDLAKIIEFLYLSPADFMLSEFAAVAILPAKAGVIDGRQ